MLHQIQVTRFSYFSSLPYVTLISTKTRPTSIPDIFRSHVWTDIYSSFRRPMSDNLRLEKRIKERNPDQVHWMSAGETSPQLPPLSLSSALAVPLHFLLTRSVAKRSVPDNNGAHQLAHIRMWQNSILSSRCNKRFLSSTFADKTTVFYVGRLPASGKPFHSQNATKESDRCCATVV